MGPPAGLVLTCAVHVRPGLLMRVLSGYVWSDAKRNSALRSCLGGAKRDQTAGLAVFTLDCALNMWALVLVSVPGWPNLCGQGLQRAGAIVALRCELTKGPMEVGYRPGIAFWPGEGPVFCKHLGVGETSNCSC